MEVAASVMVASVMEAEAKAEAEAEAVVAEAVEAERRWRGTCAVSACSSCCRLPAST